MERRLRFLLLLVMTILAASLTAPPAAAVPPPIHFRLHDEAAMPTARLCERVWREHGAAVADAILPAGVEPDTVQCLILPTATFAQYFARSLPDWGVGVAMPPGKLIALDHERLPTVGPGPESVFLHEMTHAYLFQGAGEAALPTWLHEGAAMQVSGEWRFTDNVNVILEGRLPSLVRLEGPFPRSAVAAQQAYRTSLLAVNWLESQHGPRAVPRIVAAAGRTGDFEAAFFEVTGETAGDFAARFAGAMRLRYGWVLLLFRWPTLFVIMSLVFVVGAVRKIVIQRRSLREPEDEDGMADPDDRAGGGGFPGA